MRDLAVVALAVVLAGLRFLYLFLPGLKKYWHTWSTPKFVAVRLLSLACAAAVILVLRHQASLPLPNISRK